MNSCSLPAMTIRQPAKERPNAKHLNGSAHLPPCEEAARPRTKGKANRIYGLEFDEGALHPGDIAVLYGPSGVGKTFTRYAEREPPDRRRRELSSS
jgi:hypothetical protein